MATSVAQIHFKALKSNRSYVKDCYVVDTDAALDRWDAGNGASSASPDYIDFPEDVIMTDYAQIAATGQTRSVLQLNGQPTGSILRNALHIPSATIINRPYIGLFIPYATKLSIRALA